MCVRSYRDNSTQGAKVSWDCAGNSMVQKVSHRDEVIWCVAIGGGGVLSLALRPEQGCVSPGREQDNTSLDAGTMSQLSSI